MTLDYVSIRKQFEENGQGHVFQFWDTLSNEEQQSLLTQLKEINVPLINKIFKEVMTKHEQKKADLSLEPPQEIASFYGPNADHQRAKELRDIGLKNIAEGKVAVLLLAGGQGTRLGTTDPKGMYDIGLPSHKSLFQIQAERLIRVQQLAAKQYGKDSVTVPWYVMTSPFTDKATIKFFEEKNYFGLDKNNVIFFNQGNLPCISMEGKIILESKSRVAEGPDGNGGIYIAMGKLGILRDMRARGIEYVHTFGVDNVLVKVADPLFMGYCIDKRADCGSKVTPKAYPEEKVGLFVKKNGQWDVVEYSEMPADLIKQVDPVTGRLRFNASNIANHFYTVSFLERCSEICKEFKDYHVAIKKIKYADEVTGETKVPKDNNGIKLELFIFDLFRFSENMAVMESTRDEEFAPVKNAPGSAQDSPDTARRAVSRLHKEYIRRAGGSFANDISSGDNTNNNNSSSISNNDEDAHLCEISPLVSYEGEGLEHLVSGKIFTLPLLLQ